jgi:hypothetical protein
VEPRCNVQASRPIQVGFTGELVGSFDTDTGKTVYHSTAGAQDVSSLGETECVGPEAR